MIEASLSRLVVATQQVWGKYDMKANNKKARLKFYMHKVLVISYALINLVNK
jgi:hypothetical protein